MSSAEVRYLKINYNEVLRKLKHYADVMGRTHDTKAIILVGSLAEGTYTGTSDADIMIIADDIPARSLERYELFADPSLDIDLEPRIYTTKEFLNNLERGDQFAIKALTMGVPLFGEPFYKNLRSKRFDSLAT